MPRPVRIDFPGAKHHVMNRGLRRGPVFIDDWCCQEFLALLPEAVERFEIVVHGYALMPNHYHLLLESTHGNLSRAMAFVSSTFSSRLNSRFHWDGSVFRGRFHNRVVTTPEHWHYLLAYIHLNPLKARIVISLEQSRWTSHAAYAKELSCPDWLTTDSILSQLDGVDGYRQYIEEIQQGRRPTLGRATIGKRCKGGCLSLDLPSEGPKRAIGSACPLRALYPSILGPSGDLVRGRLLKEFPSIV
jgi:putative transposase